jgi:hypothetical protein
MKGSFWRLMACLLAALALAACTHSSSSDDNGTAGPGTIRGLATLVGGPVTLNGKPALRHAPARNWPITIRSQAGEVHHTRSDENGQYVFEVEPGTYTLECVHAQEIVVTAGESVDSKCVIPVP